MIIEEYCKVPKILDTRNFFAVIYLKCKQRGQTLGFHQKDANGIAKSENPAQTDCLIWVYTVCPGLYVRKLRIACLISQ